MKRNEPCHCGSGQKYKKCCQQKDRRALPRSTQLIILALLPIALGGVLWSLVHGEDESEQTSRFSTAVSDSATPAAQTTNPMGTPGPQPPGPAPEGKVWSEEHGHWHDAAPVQVQSSTTGSGLAATLGEQPGDQPKDGEERNGRVWSAAHGHWHDKDAPQQTSATTPAIPRDQIPTVSIGGDGQTARSTPVPQPDGPVPEGKVWSPEHGHWHDKPTFSSPRSSSDPD